MIEVLKQAHQLLLTEPHAPTVCDQLEVIFRQAIAELESQEPVCPDCKAKVLYECVACSSNNYPPQRTEHEPVAWLEPEWREKICPEVGYEVTMTDDHPRDLCWIPLYATPPTAQRTWVGLTDEEFHEACWESYVDPVTGECSTGDREYAVRWTEAKLKEKNT
jgi:hypothetical protein